MLDSSYYDSKAPSRLDATGNFSSFISQTSRTSATTPPEEHEKAQSSGSRSAVSTTSGTKSHKKSGSKREKRPDDSPLPPQTLTAVHNQVAREMAVRAVMKAEIIDNVRTGVIFSMGNASGGSESSFLRLVADHLHAALHLRSSSFLFILADASPGASLSATTTSDDKGQAGNVLFVVGSTPELIQRGALLTCSKFVGRLVATSESSTALRLLNFSTSAAASTPFSPAQPDVTYTSDLGGASSLDPSTLWSALIKDLGDSAYDDTALRDVVRKASRAPIDPLRPPPGSKSIDEMLSDARAKLQRLSPAQAYRELQNSSLPTNPSRSGISTGVTGTSDMNSGGGAPALLVDIRPQAQREKHGVIPGALCIERNVLEWRLDPRCDARLAIADRYDLVVIVFCQEGYTSSLAAYSLQQIGLLNATDIVGGFEAWRVAGLPVEITPANGVPQERSLASRAGSVV
ncbi:hypothetical protein FA13DRAFT_1740424 [Coprinellus micaceus]|uniref:Rhodanese domain-containing protein n=1 Tax=Coprinellus micaceus TaxID=71717 RepID=A0A4Y7SMK4_COPMI|nr:hypothetical protein FA13DRAFT_1740424 [Coprinellus micaceus]